MKPTTDLCFQGQQNITQIMRSANLSEEAKSERLQDAEEHLQLAKIEHELYKIEECKTSTTIMHYSFDYAQQVLFLQKPGLAFFQTARKCQIFGIACEPLGKQVNYLIDEAQVVGLEANATISMLDHCLKNYGQKEDHFYCMLTTVLARTRTTLPDSVPVQL